MTAATTRRAGTVTSVERVGLVLQMFLNGRHSVAVTEVARRLGVANSTAHRLLRSLCGAGLLEQNPETRRYELSLLVYKLGNLAVTRSDLYRRAFGPLERLHHASGEGCHVSVLDAPEVVYVEHRDSDRTSQFISRMGVRAPANCTSTGKVLLAYAPEHVLEGVLADGLARLTPQSITDPSRFGEELAAIRERGYAQSCDEMEIGTTSVATPITDGEGTVLAAVGIAGPTPRMHRLSLSRAVELALACSAEISQQLSPLRRVRGASFPQGGIPTPARA